MNSYIKWSPLVWCLWVVLLLLLFFSWEPRWHLYVSPPKNPIPLWAWIVALAPALLAANQAFYVQVVKRRSVLTGTGDGGTSADPSEARKAKLEAERKRFRDETFSISGLCLAALFNALAGAGLVYVLYWLPDSLQKLNLDSVNGISSNGISSSGIVAGVLGAYVYCLWNLGRRTFQHDITSGAAWWSGVQLVLAPFLGQVAYYYWTKQIAGTAEAGSVGAVSAAFLAGFSPRLVMPYVTRLARRVSGVPGAAPADRTLQLGQIRGINEIIEERLSEEDVYDVYNLSMANPIRLAMHTTYDVRQIAGWIDEALLMYYFPKEAWLVLENQGITGATDLACLVRTIEGSLQNQHDQHDQHDQQAQQVQQPQQAQQAQQAQQPQQLGRDIPGHGAAILPL